MTGAVAEAYYANPPPGIVMGLAANATSFGSAVFIETVAERMSDKCATNMNNNMNNYIFFGITMEGTECARTPRLHYTGHLGETSRESVEIAYTFAQNVLKERRPENSFFQETSLHLNWLHGEIGKDGPSAVRAPFDF